MKDFEPVKKADDNKQLSAEQRQVRRETHTRSVSHYPCHTVFEFEVSTGVIVPAKIETVSMDLATVKPVRGESFSPNKTVSTIRKKIMERPGCLYCSALNAKNAHKRFMKMYAMLVKVGAIVQPNQ